MPVPQRSFVVASLLLAGFVSGQAAPRAKLRGRVRGIATTLSGKPWVGAKVTLLGHPTHDSNWIKSVDTIEVVTDERGRFSAMVLRHRPYLVWASERVSPTHSRISQVRSNCTSGCSIQLGELNEQRQHREFVALGYQDWTPHGRLSITLNGKIDGDVPGSWRTYAMPIQLDAEGKGRTPVWPDRKSSVQGLFYKGGWAGQGSFAAAIAPEAKPVSSLEYQLKEPLKSRMRVLLDDKPCVNVHAMLRWRDGVFIQGVTNKEGVADMLVVGTKSTRIQLGFGGHGMFVTTWKREGVPLDEAMPDPVEVQLVRGHDLSLRLVADGKPLARMPLLLSADKGTASDKSGQVDFAPNLIETDKQGRVVVTCLPSKGRYYLRALPTPKHWSLLRYADKVHCASSIVVAAGALPGKSADLGDIDLARFELLDIRAEAADGRPGERASVSVKHAEYSLGMQRLATDRRGRLRIPIIPGSAWRIGAQWVGAEVQAIKVPSATPKASAREPNAIVAAKSGAPRGNASPEGNAKQGAAAQQSPRELVLKAPRQRLIAGRTMVSGPKGLEPLPGVLVVFYVGGIGKYKAQVRSNAKGEFELPLDRPGATYTVVAEAWPKKGKVTAKARIGVGDREVVLELR